MSGPPSPLIENYLREVGFWHAAIIGQRCKLNPKLINVLIKRWRPETHTFHLPCGECTITLEDVQLQLGLSVDGSALTRIRYARTYILEMIGGYLMPDLSRNLVHLRWLLKLVDFRTAGKLSWESAVLATLYRWNHPASYIGIPSALEDIRLLLDQQLETQFQWTPYEDPAIRAVIPEEFFQNLNIWHVKVPLDPWQTIFAVGRVEASANPCGKGTTGPFKFKEKG
ncbi:hypothetical protein CXB51_028798 [Gossypium anomalum]|uniref:Aminotransferase-like plant mobile domain-containing protein n=1 Tax=Gossypium anomalum TaxID=47600 RepID=A0A8J6CQI5_9ROSI|nr:hypothetical protein CXB51_028798 [Gossypium anomalum]